MIGTDPSSPADADACDDRVEPPARLVDERSPEEREGLRQGLLALRSEGTNFDVQAGLQRLRHALDADEPADGASDDVEDTGESEPRRPAKILGAELRG